MSGGGGGSIARAAARGVVAAMAMTGMRRVTTGLGLEQPPPEEMAEHAAGVSKLFDLVPAERRDEAIEVTHWAFGGVAGALYGSLVPEGTRTRWAGPVYGLAIWALFEAGLRPLLGVRNARRTTLTRVFVAADHALYGAIVGNTWPHRP
jgi:hypothetical protein